MRQKVAGILRISEEPESEWESRAESSRNWGGDPLPFIELKHGAFSTNIFCHASASPADLGLVGLGDQAAQLGGFAAGLGRSSSGAAAEAQDGGLSAGVPQAKAHHRARYPAQGGRQCQVPGASAGQGEVLGS